MPVASRQPMAANQCWRRIIRTQVCGSSRSMPIPCKFGTSAIGGKSGMRVLLDHPIILLLVLLVIFGLATRLGAAMRVWLGPVDESKRGDFDIVLGASLTLLSLIVGFSFAMAGSR